MAKNHKRSSYFGYNLRVSNRLSHNTLAKTGSKNLSYREQYTLDLTRDKQTCEKGGYNPRTPHTHGVLQSFISGTKERRLILPSHCLKKIHPEQKFSNGKLNVHKAPFKHK